MKNKRSLNIEPKLLDKECFDAVDSNPNMLVPWYLMAAYAYYVDDDPIISDASYDALVRNLLAHWDQVEHHHKHILSKEQLEAGTFLGEYPSRVKWAVRNLRDNIKK